MDALPPISVNTPGPSDRCQAFNRVCQVCGTRFEEGAMTCGNCGAIRPRCKNKLTGGEDKFCKVHAKSKYTSIYNMVASKVSDTTIEQLLEDGKLRDVTAEFALAKLALAELHQMSSHPSDRLEALAKFFSIAKTLQTLEAGGLLNSAWNEPLISAMRSKFRQLIGLTIDLVRKYVPGVELQSLFLDELRTKAKEIGNSITVTQPADKV